MGKIRRVELRGREEELSSGTISTEWRDDQLPEMKGPELKGPELKGPAGPAYWPRVDQSGTCA